MEEQVTDERSRHIILVLQPRDAVVRGAGHQQPQPGDERDVFGGAVCVHGGAVRAAGGVFPRGDSGAGVRGRGDGAVFVRHHAVEHQGVGAAEDSMDWADWWAGGGGCHGHAGGGSGIVVIKY